MATSSYSYKPMLLDNKNANKCFINSSIQLIDNMDLNNYKIRPKNKKTLQPNEQEILNYVMGLLETRNLEYINPIITECYNGSQ